MPVKKPIIVILDTNFLLVPAAFGVDIFSEIGRVCAFKHDFAVFRQSLAELERLAQQGQKGQAKASASAARLALSLIKAKNINILSTAVKHADDAVVAYARQHRGVIIATQDKKLRERLKKAGIRVIVLRQKKYVQVL